MDVPDAAAPAKFRLTKAEQELSGISYDDGTLVVRSTLLVRSFGVAMVLLGSIFVVAGFVGAVASIGAIAIVIPVAGVAFVLRSLGFIRSAIVATQDGLCIRTLRERRLSWNQIDDLRITDRPRWRIGWNTEVMQAVLHSGKRIRLWMTLSNKGEWLLYGGPSAARLRRDVLIRYREMYTNP